ncbi:hypothetical protein P154DRAFT_474327 [Amniculicola lignicola CBS 123094]|uniref:Prolyl 4-hydroxylase alpha subunit Fe(2+) 2OG dioxygenase domain-containing protein n=1 Tax=Amniculicola lignicola CBS 123094 TaxID=1392246 RepID=A0A6A5W0C1_9PLEO|nr:hypothetical protein P154DRAFT_474327 [Amniculicola lignicola CBS 123094]
MFLLHRTSTLSAITRAHQYCLRRNIVTVQQAPSNIAPPKQIKLSKWKRQTEVPLTRENYLDLLHGLTPLIKESNFLTTDECWEYEKLLSKKLTPYKHNTGPLLTRYGVAQFEYQAQAAEDFLQRSNEKNQYFADAAEYLDLHSDLQKSGLDAWTRVFNHIKVLFPDWDVEIASEKKGSRKYFSGIFRALNDATHIHCDWSPYDSLTEDWIINQVECQVVFNLYLAPVRGGRTIVHDLQWSEEVLKFRDPKSYGYYPELVQDCQKAYVVPEPGALCFFNSRNMHEVEMVEKEPMVELDLAYRPRLTLSSFMGLIPSAKTGGRPKLIFWS